MQKYIMRAIVFTIVGGLAGLFIESIMDIETVFMFTARMIHDHPVAVIGMVAGGVFGLTSILNRADAETIRTLRNKEGETIHTLRNKKGDKIRTVREDDRIWTEGLE